MLTRSPLRVAVLCSRRAPGLADVLARSRSTQRWQIVCCVSSDELCDETTNLLRRGVPFRSHPVRRFYENRRPGAPLGDMSVRAEYDAATVGLLQPYAPDVVLLAGYLLVLTDVMLTTFPGRVFNVHHSDLLQRTPGGAPRYPGLRAVRDAILAGERETRSTAHTVTARLDDGPPLVRSWPFAVPRIAAWAIATGARDVLKSVVWSHQEWMLRDAFGPLLARTLDVVAEDQVGGSIDELEREWSVA